ncbi:hypothetical protein HBI04_146040 [Parastagonospora nodorum]|nr:hypothetical protein HBI03_146690 [Parastagonospora nodorum]KAH4271989.1 hypothetical protein HBI04_146040 [Parastagonospora nodorum]KAH5479213.1 hypothetical protein HBI28_045400 [Parastagonospora nodorum]KAH5642177.1 hypothetical protein HBI22_049630 [Parastagonospora nodorum]KAH5664997.1 hypothetical protein HBI44_229380 [Parastagonospora nodorum]
MDLKGIGDDLYRCYSYANILIYFRGVTPDGIEACAAVNIEARIVRNLAPGLLLGMDVLGPEKIIIDIGKRHMLLPHCQGMRIPIATDPKASTPLRPQKIMAKERIVIPAYCATFVPIRADSPLPKKYDLNFKPYRKSPVRASIYEGIIDSETDHILMRNDTNKDVVVPARTRLGYAHALNIDGCYRVNESLGVGAAVQGLGDENETTMQSGIHIYGKSTSENVEQLAPICKDYPTLFTDRGTTVDIPEQNHMRIPLIPGWENVKLNIKPYNQTPEEKELIDKLFDKLHAEGKMSWSTQGTHFGCPVFVVWKNVTDKDGNVTRKGRPVVDLRALNDAVLKDSYPLRKQADILQDIKGATHISVIDGVSFFYQWLIAEQDRYKFALNSHRGQEYLHVAIMGYVNSIQHVQRQMEAIMRDLPFVRVYVDDFIIFSKSLAEHKDHLRTVFARLDELRFSLNPNKCYIGYPSATILGQKVDAFGLATTDERMAAILDFKFPTNANLLETYIGAVGYLRDKVPYFAQLSAPLQELKTELLRSAPPGKRERRRFGEKIQIHEDEQLMTAFQAIQSCLAKNTKLYHHDPARPLYIDIDASKVWGFGAFVYHVKDDPEPVMEDVSPPPGFEDLENGPTAWLKKVKDFPDGTIQPIMFLSKRLSPAEENYYPTELEMSAVVWVAQKLRQVIAASRKTFIFTDHSAVTAIARQKLLTSSSADRLNLRLIRCAQYLQQFPFLDVRYRPGRTHFVPDALSRLQGKTAQKEAATDTLEDLEYMYLCSAGKWDDPTDHLKFIYFPEDDRWRIADPRNHASSATNTSITTAQADIVLQQGRPEAPPTACYWENLDVEDIGYTQVFNTALVALTDDFKERLRTEIRADWHFKKVIELLQQDAPPTDDTDPAQRMSKTLRGIDFRLRDGLLYHINQIDQSERLCVPKAMMKEVFNVAHDQNFHAGYHRTYDRIRSTMFIRSLAPQLKKYIRYCGPCLVNRTERHQPYGSLEPISILGMPHHTIAIDLVTGLPASKAGFDALMTTTCKQTKHVLLIPGMNDWTAGEWGAALLESLIDYEWGLPKAVISDRDPRFLSELWRAMFEKANIAFLTSTAWHPQTDGQSERTNQTVEIALRYFCTANPDSDWHEALPYVKFSLNTAKSAATGVSPLQQIQGFNPRDPLSALADMPETDFQALRQQYRDMATEALAFAAVNMKHTYDAKHKPLNLKKGDWVMLRLHHGYRVQGHLNRKLDMQRSSPVQVIGKVGKNAYKLDLPGHMKIHPVVSVAQLEPCPRGEDPFQRTFEARQGPVESTQEDAPLYEIERLLARRLNKRTGCRQYLVQWKGWGSVHNVWYDEADLSGAKEMVAEYDSANPESSQEKLLRESFAKKRRSARKAPPPLAEPPAPQTRSPAQPAPSKASSNVSDGAIDHEVRDMTTPPLRRKSPRVVIPARRRD